MVARLLQGPLDILLSVAEDDLLVVEVVGLGLQGRDVNHLAFHVGYVRQEIRSDALLDLHDSGLHPSP